MRFFLKLSLNKFIYLQNGDKWQKMESWNVTVILSFLKRERERTVTVILQSFYLVQYDRCIPFTVPDRSQFLTVTMTNPNRSWKFLTVSVRFMSVLETIRNGQERSW